MSWLLDGPVWYKSDEVIGVEQNCVNCLSIHGCSVTVVEVDVNVLVEVLPGVVEGAVEDGEVDIVV